ncbi:MAG TPA: cyclase family protein [Bryobacteraceae bacterium]|nr:cyclase family protein [Bryobacteraceae bacterium]
MTPPRITRRNWFTRAGIVTGAALAARDAVSAATEKYPRNLTREDVDRWMKEMSNWGKWGPDDQAGTINLITPAKRKAAAGLVKDGVSVSASLNADLPKEGPTGVPLPVRGGGGGGRGRQGGLGGPPGGGGPPPQGNAAEQGRGRGPGGGPANRFTWSLATRPPGPEPRPLAAYVVDTISVSYHGNNTTHLDALSHIYYHGQIYNGYPQTSYTDRGAGKNDVMAFKNGIFTRGILFDIPKLKNVPYLGDDEAIYPEDLEAWEKKAGVRLESGDAMLVRTGRWVRVREKGDLNLNVATPGLYASCVKWMRERGVAILGSDVVQDVRPSRVEGVNQPIHQMALMALGTPLIDNCNLEAVAEAAAQRRRWAFLLTINPLRIPGATGGPVNPIATF